MYFTYILRSKIAKKTYVGHTDNLKRRIWQHNTGRGSFSKRYKPWELTHSETFKNQKEALRREKYFKSAAGRRWIKKNLFGDKR